MSVANISPTLPGAVPGLPARAVDAAEGRLPKPRDGVSLSLDSAEVDQSGQQTGVPADRFDPSPFAELSGSDPSQAAASQKTKADKAKAFERELAAIRQAAAQTRYGVSGQLNTASVQRDFESLLVAVNTGDLTAAEQALTRLQGATDDAGAVVVGDGTTAQGAAPLPVAAGAGMPHVGNSQAAKVVGAK